MDHDSSLNQRLRGAVNRRRLLDTATRLIAVQSWTGDAGAVSDCLADLLHSDGFKVERTFKIDPSKKPKTVDATATAGDSAGKARQGIYVLEGKTAKACFATAGEERPKAFETKADSGHYLWELEKEK